MTAPLAIPVVSANNGLNLSLNTDQNSYGANTPVAITAGVGNAGVSAQGGSVHLWVYAQDGTLVTDLGTQNFTGLAPTAQQALSGAWNTSTLLPSAYYVQATLFDNNGHQVSTARKDLVIVASSATGTLLSGQVTTDKGSYGALDTVQLTDRVANLTRNALVGDLQLTTQITSPAGQVIWSHEDALTQLVAGGLKDFSFAVPVANAADGTYTISLVVTDSSGAVQAQSSTHYVVLSSAVNGVGLSGTLALAGNTLVRGDTQTLNITLKNQGNANISALPVTISIIDPVTDTVVTQWQDTVDALATSGNATLTHSWVTEGGYDTHLVAVLTTALTGPNHALAQAVFTLVKPPLTLAVASDQPIYDVNDVATLASTVTSAANIPLSNLSLAQKIVAADGTVLWQSTVTEQALAANATLTRQAPVTLGRSPAGNYQAQLSVLDADGVQLAQTSTAFQIRSTAVSGIGLTGSVVVSPNDVPQGDTTVIGLTIGNQGNSDITTLPVSLLITDVATGQVVKQFDLTVASLVQDTLFTQAFDWAPVGTTGTVYDVKLVMTVGGVTRQLAETTLKVVTPPLKLGVDQHAGGQSRVLVYLSCHPDWHLNKPDWKYGEHNDPCFQTRATTLRHYLDQLGVPYLIVTEADDFRRELRSGRYNNYWLLGAVETLSHNMLEELREAVFRGDSLIADGGLQRWSNHDLYPLLGLSYRGHLSCPNQQATFTAPVFGPAMSTYGAQPTSGKPLFLQASTGMVTAILAGNACTVSDFADPAMGKSWKTPTTYAAAVADHFGQGKTLAFAFDLIDSLPAASATTPSPAWTEMLRESLAYTLPHDPATATLVPGEYQRYVVTVTNQAKAADLVTTVQLPAGATLVSTTPSATLNADGSLSFAFTLPENAAQTSAVDFRVPLIAGNYSVNTAVRVAGASSDYRTYNAAFGVQDSTNRASQARVALSALPVPAQSQDGNRQTQALSKYDVATQHYQQGQWSVALAELAEVAEKLGEFTQTDTTAARLSVDGLLHDWEAQWWRACATTSAAAGQGSKGCGP